MNEYLQDANIAIVAYRPKPGKEEELMRLTREHVPILRAQGLATDRPVIACRAADGTIVEVFEWVAGGIERAHSNPAVHALWTRYAEACDYVPLASVEESSNLFASFLRLPSNFIRRVFAAPLRRLVAAFARSRPSVAASGSGQLHSRA